MKLLLTAFSLTAVCAVQAGIVVDAQSDVPRRVCADHLTFSWDWSWDWIPSSAQEATLALRKTGGACLLSNVVGRAVSSVTWDVGNLLATNADTSVDVTLSFPCADKLRASRTVTYEVREGAFAAHVRACETNSVGYPSRAFRKVNHYVLKRMARFLNRKSQRYYRLKFADTYYGEMTHYGLYRLAWADVRRAR